MVDSKRYSQPTTAAEAANKQEFRNPMHRGAAHYKHENEQIKELYKRTKTKKKEVLNLAKAQAQHLATLSGVASPSQDTSLPLLVTATAANQATMPARVVLLQRQSILESRPAAEESRPHSRTEVSSVQPSERTGPGLQGSGQPLRATSRRVPHNPVSTRLMDLDDILTNVQFHKRALKTDDLHKKFQLLKK